MYQGKSVSVVIGTYREKNSIRRVIEDFFATGFVDEVIIVNNNAEPGTDEEVKQTKARLVYESRQGYGFAYRRGIQEATGDYIVLCEADGTFAASDLERFLVFAKDFPAVFGSRTNRSSLIDTKTMNPVRRIADVIYAKTIEVLYGTTTLTDIGCTYKLFRRDAIEKLQPHFTTTNSLFCTELMLVAATHGVPFVEIPVTFQERVGISGTTPHFWKLVEWAVRIWWFIWATWWKRHFKKFIALVVGIALAGIGAEIALRALGYDELLKITEQPAQYYVPDSEMGYDIKPNSPRQTLNIGKTSYEIWSNEIGCFDTAYQKEQNYILLLGDSFTHAWTPFEDKFGTLMEHELQRRVLKCGVAGFGTEQELIKAKKVISATKQKPKLIVVGYYTNDFGDDTGYEARLAYYASHPEAAETRGVENANGKWIFNHIVTYRLTRTFVKNLVTKSSFAETLLWDNAYSLYFKTETDATVAKKWQEHIGNLRAFQQLADSQGAKLLVVLIPSRPQVYDFISRFPEKEKQYYIEHPQKVIKEALESEHIQYIDLLPEFRERANLKSRLMLDSTRDFFWASDAHLSIPGNHLAAKLISQFIKDNNLIR